MRSPSAASLALASALLVDSAVAASKSYDWTITYGKLVNTSRDAILINKQWPPPAIEVKVNDTIVVTANNQGVEEGVSLHAHGFRQVNNNQHDGPVGVTQCALSKGNNQTYTWPASDPGTYWVHSHRMGQYPWGLRAPLIVRSDEEAGLYGYDASADFVMDFADQYNQSMKEVEYKYTNASCCFNGQGQQSCGLEVPPDSAVVHDNLSGSQTYNASSSLASGGKMRVRLINMSAASTFLIFANDPDVAMSVIELDGVSLKASTPATIRSILVHPGQRYSVVASSKKSFVMMAVVEPSQYTTNSCQKLNSYQSNTEWNYALMATAKFDMGTGAMPEPYFKPNAYCTSSTRPCYVKRGVQDSSPTLNNLPDHAADLSKRMTDEWFADGQLTPRDAIAKIKYGSDSDSTIIHVKLSATQGSTRWSDMNDKQFASPQIPILLRQLQPAPTTCASGQTVPQPGLGQSAESYYAANNTNNVKFGTNVFFVVQVATGPNSHPFHLHGHNFQVLYQSSTAPADSDIKANSLSMPDYPLRRDTMFMTSKNYTVIAIKADNPGSWFYHCHNDFHSMSGMAGALVVDPAAAGNSASSSSDAAAAGTAGAAWNSSAIGQAAWDQCRFTTQSGAGFAAWTKTCCASSSSCAAGPAVKNAAGKTIS